MSMAMAIFSPKLPCPSLSPPSQSPHSKPTSNFYPHLLPRPFSSSNRSRFHLHVAADNASGVTTTVTPEDSVGSNGSPSAVSQALFGAEVGSIFQDSRWVSGTWDLKQFEKDGETDWDAVIDAEVKRRKWMEDNPQSSSNDNPIVFDTSIIPWWAWIKRFHLPEAELLNGRAAMIGFFMAYFVDSLTGLGLVDQMNNFICKTLLLVAVSATLLIRKNEDIETLKKLLEETTFYDKQWQATWQEDGRSSSGRKEGD